MKRKVFLWVVLFLCLGYQGVICAEGRIGERLKSQEPVKVYVAAFTNSSGQNQVTPENYKQNLEKALLARKSLQFVVVKNPGDSQIQIAGIIKKYQYLEKGSLKVTPSMAMIAIDAVQTATGNFAEMDADFTVTNTKNNETMWKDTISTYLKKKMTPEESISLISDKVSKTFIVKCFGKPK